MKQLTKDELKKEAEKWLCNNLHSASEEDFIKAKENIWKVFKFYSKICECDVFRVILEE